MQQGGAIGACGRFADKISSEAPALLAHEGLKRPQGGLTLDWSTQTVSKLGHPNVHAANDPLMFGNIATGPNDSDIETASLVFLAYVDGTFIYEGCVALPGGPGASVRFPLVDPRPDIAAEMFIDPVYQGNLIYQNTNDLVATPVMAKGTLPNFYSDLVPNKHHELPPIVTPEFDKTTLRLEQVAGAPCTQTSAKCLDVGYFVLDATPTDFRKGSLIGLKPGRTGISGMDKRTISLVPPKGLDFRLVVCVSGYAERAYTSQTWVVFAV